MSTDKIIAAAYGHFLQHCDTYEKSQPVFEWYATDELGLPPEEARQFIRPVLVEDEQDINTQEFARFYTWYYVNVMAAATWDTRILLPVAGTFIDMAIAPMKDFSKGGHRADRLTTADKANYWALFLQRDDGPIARAAECRDEAAAQRLQDFLRRLLAHWKFSLDAQR